MKTFCLVLFLLFTLSAVCNDTLTRAQVYNFNVGDTFDYRGTSSYTGTQISFIGEATTTYTRFIITGIYYSSGHDTLFIVREQAYPAPYRFDTLIVNSLTQYEYSQFYNNCGQTIIDTSAYYNNAILNSTCYNGLENYAKETFANGLGIVYSENGGGDPQDGFEQFTSTLIYYSNANIHWGSPYEIESGIRFINYLPIPEECATWIRSIYNFESNTSLALQEKVTEGNKIPFHSHVYIPLLYSYYNYNDNGFRQDSMLGYFRNDTINQSAYLYHSLSDTSFATYDFRTQVGDRDICSMDTLIFSTGYRARWNGCYYQDEGMIEGVGGGGSIWPIQSPRLTNPNVYLTGSLTSFCVCGEVLYSRGYNAACEILSAISDAQPSAQIRIYPNPTSGLCTLNFNGTTGTFSASILDITGREVMPLFSNRIISTFNFSMQSLSAGLYFVKVYDAQGHYYLSKLVKE